MLDTLIIFGAKYLYLVILLVALLVLVRMPRPEGKRLIIFAVIALPVMYIVAKLAGHFYFDPRPFVDGHFMPLIPHVADNGFPSDHTLLSAGLAAVVFMFRRFWGFVLMVLAVLVGAVRVLAGIHHPADIIGSVVIAIVVTGIVYLVVIPQRFKQA